MLDKSIEHKKTMAGFSRKLVKQAEEIKKLREELQSTRQVIKNLINDRANIADSANHRNNVALHEREQKLIEGLQTIRQATKANTDYALLLVGIGIKCDSILREIGVTDRGPHSQT